MSASVVVEGYGAKIQQHRIVGGGGTTLNVLETGKRDGPTVLFIHGFSQNALAWSKQLNSELARDFRLVAMDIRGHGNSDKPPKDAYTDSKLWADDVQAVIESLELNRPVLSGWSYGGLIMCDYLSVYGEKPSAASTSSVPSPALASRSSPTLARSSWPKCQASSPTTCRRAALRFSASCIFASTMSRQPRTSTSFLATTPSCLRMSARPLQPQPRPRRAPAGTHRPGPYHSW